MATRSSSTVAFSPLGMSCWMRNYHFKAETLFLYKEKIAYSSNRKSILAIALGSHIGGHHPADSTLRTSSVSPAFLQLPPSHARIPHRFFHTNSEILRQKRPPPPLSRAKERS